MEVCIPNDAAVMEVDTMKRMQGITRRLTKPARRPALGLVASLAGAGAITLGSVAAPLAGAALTSGGRVSGDWGTVQDVTRRLSPNACGYRDGWQVPLGSRPDGCRLAAAMSPQGHRGQIAGSKPGGDSGDPPEKPGTKPL